MGLFSLPALARSLDLKNQYKAILFDGFVLLNPASLTALVTELYPDKGMAFLKTGRTKQFEYSWLRASASEYQDFWKVTHEALQYAAASNGLTLSIEAQETHMKQYLQMPIWDDVKGGLETLQTMGIPMGFLSNMTPKMLWNSGKKAGIAPLLKWNISTDEAKTYKLAKQAYQLGVAHTGFNKSEIIFVAFAGWDAWGAKGFGYPTFWLNRMHQPKEGMNVEPDGMGYAMQDLVAFLGK